MRREENASEKKGNSEIGGQDDTNCGSANKLRGRSGTVAVPRDVDVGGTLRTRCGGWLVLPLGRATHLDSGIDNRHASHPLGSLGDCGIGSLGAGRRLSGADGIVGVKSAVVGRASDGDMDLVGGLGEDDALEVAIAPLRGDPVVLAAEQIPRGGRR